MTQHTQRHGAGDAPVYAQGLERMNRFKEPEARMAIAHLYLPAGSCGLDVGGFLDAHDCISAPLCARQIRPSLSWEIQTTTWS